MRQDAEVAAPPGLLLTLRAFGAAIDSLDRLLGLRLTAPHPQHLEVPSFTSIDLTPETGLSVTSETPVSKKDLPSVGLGFSLVSANFLIASMPSAAIISGYCCDVAPITPSLTDLTPGQP